MLWVKCFFCLNQFNFYFTCLRLEENRQQPCLNFCKPEENLNDNSYMYMYIPVHVIRMSICFTTISILTTLKPSMLENKNKVVIKQEAPSSLYSCAYVDSFIVYFKQDKKMSDMEKSLFLQTALLLLNV